MLFHTKFYQLISTRSFSLNGSFWFVVWKCGDAQLVLITMELLPITKKGGYCKNIISVFGGSEEAKVIGGETQQQRDVTKGKAITGVLSIIFNHRCRGFRSPVSENHGISRGGLPKKTPRKPRPDEKKFPSDGLPGKTWFHVGFLEHHNG